MSWGKQTYLSAITNGSHGGVGQGAADCLPGSVKGHLGYVLSHQGDNVILPLIENAVEARLELQPNLPGNR
jgi:hypothetical protein